MTITYISFFFNLMFIYIIYNLYVNLTEIENKIQIILNDKLNFYNFILGLLTKCYSEIDKVDKNGSFSSDDEIGFAFGVIKGSIQETLSEIEKLKEEESAEEKN